MRRLVISLAFLLSVYAVEFADTPSTQPTTQQADSLDRAEAKRRGVPVEMILMEKRIAELERENKELLSKVATLEHTLKPVGTTATPPAKAGNPGPVTTPTVRELSTAVEKLLDQLPVEMRASDKDTSIQTGPKAKQCDAWLKANVVGKEITFSATVQDVSISKWSTANAKIPLVTAGTATPLTIWGVTHAEFGTAHH